MNNSNLNIDLIKTLHFHKVLKEDFTGAGNYLWVARLTEERDEQDAIEFAQTCYPDREWDTEYEYETPTLIDEVTEKFGDEFAGNVIVLKEI